MELMNRFRPLRFRRAENLVRRALFLNEAIGEKDDVIGDFRARISFHA